MYLLQCGSHNVHANFNLTSARQKIIWMKMYIKYNTQKNHNCFAGVNGAFILAYYSAVLYKLKHNVKCASCCELLKSSYEFTPPIIQPYKKKLMGNNSFFK